MKHLLTFVELNESLPQESTVKQLERIRKETKSVTIDDKISDMSKQGANIQYIHNPVDTGVESIQDYWDHNDPIKITKTKSK